VTEDKTEDDGQTRQMKSNELGKKSSSHFMHPVTDSESATNKTKMDLRLK